MLHISSFVLNDWRDFMDRRIKKMQFFCTTESWQGRTRTKSNTEESSFICMPVSELIVVLSCLLQSLNKLLSVCKFNTKLGRKSVSSIHIANSGDTVYIPFKSYLKNFQNFLSLWKLVLSKIYFLNSKLMTLNDRWWKWK